MAIGKRANQWSLSSYSDIGKRRENQDRQLLIAGDKGLLAVVADGMGGHKDGDIAASELIRQANLWYSDENNLDLLSVIYNTHDKLNREAAKNNGSLGNSAQTACVVLWLRGKRAEVAHVGDTRCYQFRSGKLIERTQDHSIVQLLVLRGEVDEEEMGSHPDQNRLTQSVGGRRPPKPDHKKFKVSKNDSFLLCSDGFWENTKAEEMAELLESDDLQHDLEQRVHTAVEKAGDKADNATAIAIRQNGKWHHSAMKIRPRPQNAEELKNFPQPKALAALFLKLFPSGRPSVAGWGAALIAALVFLWVGISYGPKLFDRFSGESVAPSAPASAALSAALVEVAHEGHTDDVRRLLDAGVDVNASKDDGWTALMLASHKGHADIVRLLEQAGAREWGA